MGSRLGSVAFSLVFFGAGCGGAADTDLFGTPSANGVDAGADVTVKDAGRDNDVPDVPPLPPFDATPDVTPPPPKSTIACGGATNPLKTCEVLTEICCRTGTEAPYTYDCLADPKDCMKSGDVPFTCTNTENCVAQGFVGNVCCASLISVGSGSVAYDVSCMPTAKCTGANQKAVVCDPKSQNPCPNGGSCKLSSQTLPSYYICF